LLRGIGSVVTYPLRSVRFWIALIFSVIVLLIAFYALANRYTPLTSDAYVQSYVIQIAPRVEGQVTRVPVRENQLVESGQLLFEIDPRPFAYKVQQLQASLVQRRQQVAQLESELAAVQAEEAQVAAEEAYARAVQEQETAIFQREATTERRFLDAQQKFKVAQAARARAKALIRQKEEALAARVGDVHALIVEGEAELANAELNLAWTKVHAPVKGYVTNLQLQEGAYAHVGKPVLTVIDAKDAWIVGNFRENNLQFIRPGQPVSIAFKAYPGQIFPGKVQSVGWGNSQGQGVPSGELPSIENPQQWIPLPNRFQVRVVMDDPAEVSLRVGATASLVIYTTPDYPLNPVTGFLQQLEAWFFYLR
jgi:multidrug resistance efflux pump